MSPFENVDSTYKQFHTDHIANFPIKCELHAPESFEAMRAKMAILTDEKVFELFWTGKKIDVKVTPVVKLDGTVVVHIRDYEFENAIKAQLYLTHIAKSERVEVDFLIG